MQGPSGMSKNPEECELKGEKLQANGSDSCSSPPQKRLKQAHIPFKATSPTLLNGQPKAITPDKADKNKKISSFFESKRNTPLSGMVTAKSDSPEQKRIKLDNNLNELPSTSPEKADEVMVIEDDPVTPVKTTLNTSTSSLESSPETAALSTPTNAKLPEKTAKSSEKLRREAEKKAKREERETQRLEKKRLKELQEKEKQEARAKKEKERLELKRKKELEQQQKKEEREKKEKERLEKKMIEDKEREDKNRRKEEERKKKEEERLAKLEEKNKKEEEKRQIEEEELRKKQKAQNMFKSFFKPLSATPKQVLPTPKNTFEQRFQPFVVRKDMEMAPLCRRTKLDEKSIASVDNSMMTQSHSSTYIKDIHHQKRNHKNRISKRNESSAKDDDCEVMITCVKANDKDIDISDTPEEEQKKTYNYKAKLLLFHENTRPPYYGTWRKKSKFINPRNPLAQDKDLLDYEVDSDEEWEEEDPGESISHSEGEDEGGEDNGDGDDEDEDGFFVPHGYLSDDEGVEAEDEEGEEEEEEKSGLQFDPEKKREQLIKKGRAWEAELQRKCRPMKPVVVGCTLNRETISNKLLQYKVCTIAESPIEVLGSLPKDLSGEGAENATPARHPAAMYVPEEAMPELIRMLHGSTAGLAKLVEMFCKHWSACSISKRQLKRKISEIAVKTRRPDQYYKVCWYVHEKILSQYGLQDLTVQDNSSLSPMEETSVTPRTVTPTPPPPSPQTTSILQFTKTASPTCIKPVVKNVSPKNIVRPSSTEAMEVDNSETDNSAKAGTSSEHVSELAGKENAPTTVNSTV